MTRRPLNLTASLVRRPLIKPFSIATGARTHQTVLSVQLTDGCHAGRGEATGLAYRGETPERLLQHIEMHRRTIERGIDRNDLLTLMPGDGARFALDSALWELDAAWAGTTVASQIGMEPEPVVSAYTIVLDTPEAMAAQTQAENWRPLLKVKLGGSSDEEEVRLRAVARAAGSARLVIDANAGWKPEQLVDMAPIVADLGIELIEQPLPMDSEDDPSCEAALRQATEHVPLCADESFRDLGDLPHIAPLYQAVNIKLEKCGGLTAALDIARAAREQGLLTFVGCMLAPTVAIAPALLLAQVADYADLDGPFWFPDEPARLDDSGRFLPIHPTVWGQGIRKAND